VLAETSPENEVFAQISTFIQTDTVRNKARFYSVLALLLIAVSFSGLNGTLQDVDESYFAYVARDSFERGSWIVQIELGEETFFKSPMVFWAQMLSFKLFGISDFAAKLPSAIANIITAFALFFICRRVFSSPLVAFLAVIIYQCSIQVHISSHQICTDVYYQMFLIVSLLFCVKAITDKPYWMLLAGVFNGFVFLSKSALGLVLPATLFLYVVFSKKWRFLLSVFLYFLISLCVSLPFFLAAYIKIPEMFVESFITNYLLKVVSGGSGFDLLFTLSSFPYYIVILVAMLLPFSSGWIQILFRRNERIPTREILWSEESRILSLFFLTTYIGYALIGQRLPHYTLPMIPTLAVFTAYAYSNTGKPRKVYLSHIILMSITLIVLTGFTVSQWKRYPTWRDVAIGLLAMYLIFTITNVILYVKSVPAKPGIFILSVIFFITFTITTAVTVPMDFNRDLRNFAPVYEYPAPLYMVRTREINEMGKSKPLYWYTRARVSGYRDLNSFIESEPSVEKGSYIIFYKDDVNEMTGLFPNLSIRETGKIWTIAIVE
jgi:4-amino-4-deoxy-L-arabinose transferase-like glycosyltransferase